MNRSNIAAKALVAGIALCIAACICFGACVYQCNNDAYNTAKAQYEAYSYGYDELKKMTGKSGGLAALVNDSLADQYKDLADDCLPTVQAYERRAMAYGIAGGTAAAAGVLLIGYSCRKKKSASKMPNVES